MKTLVTFGYIFCGSKLPQRTDIPTAIKNGVKINDVMTLNMEALMRTILDTGCRRDWPGYLNSSEYKNWFKQQHGTERKSKGKRKQSVDIKKPVSVMKNKMKKRNRSTLSVLTCLQKCYLSYTGSNGKVHSTAKGRGWNNEGIERFNYFIEKVYQDREKRSEDFDTRFLNFCSKLNNQTQATKNKRRRSNKDHEDSTNSLNTPNCLTGEIIKKRPKRKTRSNNNKGNDSSSSDESVQQRKESSLVLSSEEEEIDNRESKHETSDNKEDNNSNVESVNDDEDDDDDEDNQE